MILELAVITIYKKGYKYPFPKIVIDILNLSILDKKNLIGFRVRDGVVLIYLMPLHLDSILEVMKELKIYTDADLCYFIPIERVNIEDLDYINSSLLPDNF